MIKGLTIPIVEPEVFDNSMLSTFQRCPRKGFYQYALQRSPVGTNYPIQFGVAYHKFRETLEALHKKIIEEGPHTLNDPKTQRLIYELAFKKAVEVTRLKDAEGKSYLGWKEPPIGHKHEFLTENRLATTCKEAFQNWLDEKEDKKIILVLSEQSFDLDLSNGERYGGRFDQLIDWNHKLWLRDFKTTSRMGKGYGAKFEPNNQMPGYIWASQRLSNESVEGVTIEVVYNTKLKGPEFFPYLSTRTAWQLENWEEEVGYEIENVRSHFLKGMFPKRTDACDDYGGCYFREACKRDGWPNIERWLITNTIHSVWDFANPDKEEGTVD